MYKHNFHRISIYLGDKKKATIKVYCLYKTDDMKYVTFFIAVQCEN